MRNAPTEFRIIKGKPGSGKTRALLEAYKNEFKKGNKAAFLSTEMKRDHLLSPQDLDLYVNCIEIRDRVYEDLDDFEKAVDEMVNKHQLSAVCVDMPYLVLKQRMHVSDIIVFASKPYSFIATMPVSREDYNG